MRTITLGKKTDVFRRTKMKTVNVEMIVNNDHISAGRKVIIGEPFKINYDGDERYAVPIIDKDSEFLWVEDIYPNLFIGLRELGLDVMELMAKAAVEGMKNALTPHNKPNDYRVGAAVFTSKGNIYSASSYHSETHSLSLHAEHACLSHAAAHGEYDILAITIVGNDPKDPLINPCGLCKQLLWESSCRSGHDILVLLVDNKTEGIGLELNLKDIVPYPWPPKKAADK